MNTNSGIEIQSKFSIEGILENLKARYELLFPTIPDNSVESNIQRRSGIVTGLLKRNGESGDFTTLKQRKENKIAVLGTDPKTILSFGGLTLTSQDFGKPDRTRTDYTLSRAFFGKQVTVVLGADKMPWTQE